MRTWQVLAAMVLGAVLWWALSYPLRKQRRAVIAGYVDHVASLTQLLKEATSLAETRGHALAVLRPVEWSLWWLRNACEMTPTDPRRPDMIRLAIAAGLAPDVETFHQDLHSLVRALPADHPTANAARCFLDDFRIVENTGAMPWELYREHNPERDLHSRAVLRECRAYALQSWAALLTRSPVPFEFDPDNSDHGFGLFEKH